MTRGQKIAAGGVAVALAAASMVGAGVMASKVTNWPAYCAKHPKSKNRHCVPAPTTTTTTTTLPFTGCVVVEAPNDTLIVFEGSCTAAATWADAHAGPNFTIYPYTGPFCDPDRSMCIRTQ